jgi:cyclophilin family peptidyl-prolyl cis-trans isomerase
MREIKDSLARSGAPVNDAEVQELAFLRQYEILEKRGDYRIPEEHRAVYRNIGGTPRLDGTYTVFGEVIEGLEIVDRIAAVETDSTDRPVTDIRIIKMKVEKK